MKTNYEFRYASHPADAKSYDTTRLRREFLINPLFTDNEVNMVYSMYDRAVVGGAKPCKEVLPLETIDPLKASFFLHRREIGIYNVGGPGVITVDGTVYEMAYKEALYIGQGDKQVTFASSDNQKPALFYFLSMPAHKAFPDRKLTKEDAIKAEMGSAESANHRTINKMMVREVLPTCQLQMGMTELFPGSVWNTMPAHVHTRRMEAYETRHIWMKNNQAVLSPEWSIHSAAATSCYTFIWGMGGENMDYGDQDFVKMDGLV